MTKNHIDYIVPKALICTWEATIWSKIIRYFWNFTNIVHIKDSYQNICICENDKYRNKANLRDLIAATGQVISIWIQIVNFSAHVTVNFDRWPRKTIGHFFYTTSSFVLHFKSIGEFKLDLQSINAKFESKLVICYPVWPWSLMDDLGKQ